LNIPSPPIRWPNGAYRELTRDERHQRLDLIRRQRPDGPVWVFGFGSLMWNPCFLYDSRHTAVLTGWERKFHIWTSYARGTAERPGLGLCLEAGPGACKGVAFRLLPDHEERDWHALWWREMTTGIYRAIWCEAEVEGHGVVPVLTFVVDRDHRQYAGPMETEVMARIIAGASGKYGTCRDYLANTLREMRVLGVIDPELTTLLHIVDRHESLAGDRLDN